MTETKTLYTIDVSIDDAIGKLDSLTRDYIIGQARRDAQRLEAGEDTTPEGTAMTVAELIVKLQEMPQDMIAYGHDSEEGPYRLCNVAVRSVLDGDDIEYIAESGFRYTRVDPATLQNFDAVVIS